MLAVKRLKDFEFSNSKQHVLYAIVDYQNFTVDDNQLNEKQKKKIKNFRNDRLKKQYFIRCLFLKYCLQQIDPLLTEDQLTVNLFNKPLMAKDHVQFNLTHSTDEVKQILLFVIDKKLNVGIDIELGQFQQEHIDFVQSTFDLMKNQMNQLIKIDENNIHQFWPMIESLGKCFGQGLSTAFNEFEIIQLETQKAVFRSIKENLEFEVNAIQIPSIKLNKKYSAYICTQNS